MQNVAEKIRTAVSHHIQKSSIESQTVQLKTVGSYEEMLEWRQPYLDWLSSSNISLFTVSMTTVSRTSTLLITFKDPRDAVWFKLVWGGSI